VKKDFLAEQLKEAIRRRNETPPKERFRDLVDRGVIDGEGRVLLRMQARPTRHGKKTK
jgi:hypothetical protein